jgi:hypothetical protein
MRKFLLAPAVLAGTFLLVACAGDPAASTPTAPGPAATTIETPRVGEHSAGDGHDHGADEHYGVPEVTWDVGAEAQVKETAATAMTMFARPGVPEQQWFSELAPLLSSAYAEDAKYIDPARVPFNKITEGPVISREAQNPLTVTASFFTNDGPWDMMLHRAGQDEPWLVTSISSKASQ